MLPFHAWKDQQVKRDSAERGVHRFYRPRDWYYAAYGAYCAKLRAANPSTSQGTPT